MNIALYSECRKLRLPHNEKSVLLALAGRAPKTSREAFPSVETLATDIGMGTTATRRTVRSLERKGLITPKGAVKGGRGNSTTYLLSPEKANTFVLPFPGQKATDSKAKGNGFDPKTQHTGVDEGFKGKREGEESAPAPCSQNQMEKEILTVWNYYREASGSDEAFSPSRKKKGLAIVREMREKAPSNDPVICMTRAIDMVTHLGKKRPAKAALLQWDKMFSKWNTFTRYFNEYQESENVPDAARLPDEYYYPPSQ